jgi:hypothetical protein
MANLTLEQPVMAEMPLPSLLRRVARLAEVLDDAASTGDLIALRNSRLSFASALGELWKFRKEREPDWGDLLNLLQGALAKEEFEHSCSQQCIAISTIVRNHLTANEVKLDDLENSIKLLREVGLNPWKGISGRLSE